MLKKIIRKIVNRPWNGAPCTIDILDVKEDGYIVIGWFACEKARSVELQTTAGDTLMSNATFIDRPDVESQLKIRAQGFQLDVNTNLQKEEIVLAVRLTDGEVSLMPLNPGTPVTENAFSRLSKKLSGSKGPTTYAEIAIITEQHVLVSGWSLRKFDLEEAVLIDDHNQRIASAVESLNFGRPDVRESLGNKVKDFNVGFSILFELSQAGSLSDAADLYLMLKDNRSKAGDVTDQIKEVHIGSDDPMTNIQRIFNSWSPTHPVHVKKAATLMKPMLEALYSPDEQVANRRYDFGNRPENPKATIIIPLYARFDFMRYQLSNFSRFQKMREFEVIYVVDDPTISNKCKLLAKELSEAFPQPFSLVVLQKNVGFGRANNIGATFASADKLILLNSDVIPQDGEWATKLLEPLEENESAGLVGARLLFEDGSIQHDGMAPMTLQEYPGLLFNDHPCKGWPVSLSPNSPSTAECHLVTAACVAIRKSLFDELGGFDPIYILGDFEDSDLCLRAEKAGFTNIIRRDVTLNHLERLSQNLVQTGSWKHKLTIYNAIQYSERWKLQLEPSFGLAEVTK